jgi:hypothetical protein
MAYDTFQIDKEINKVYKLEKKVTKKRVFFKFFRIFYILLIYFSYSQSSYELYNTKRKSL